MYFVTNNVQAIRQWQVQAKLQKFRLFCAVYLTVRSSLIPVLYLCFRFLAGAHLKLEYLEVRRAFCTGLHNGSKYIRPYANSVLQITNTQSLTIHCTFFSIK